MERINFYKYLSIAALALFAFTSCEEDKPKVTPDFDNVIYMKDAMEKDTEPVVIEGTNESQRKIGVAMASPLDYDLTLGYDVDLSLAKKFAEANGIECEPMPNEYFSFESKEDKIFQGNLASNGVTINFIDLMQVPREAVYVLPVVISHVESGAKILRGSHVVYFVLRHGSLVNIVANITNVGLDPKSFGKHDDFKNITEITMEALINPKEYNNSVATLMGIEGYFLFRFGDNVAKGQIQIACPDGNFPNVTDPNKVIPLNKWTHIAMTFDLTKQIMKIYVDGRVQSETNFSDKKIFKEPSLDLTYIRSQWGNSFPFLIGKSWDDGRPHQGWISECRIWNVVRTREQISQNMYYVDPNSKNLLSYWKFNDGQGSEIKDYSKYGNTAYFAGGKGAIEWVPVSLP